MSNDISNVLQSHIPERDGTLTTQDTPSHHRIHPLGRFVNMDILVILFCVVSLASTIPCDEPIYEGKLQAISNCHSNVK